MDDTLLRNGTAEVGETPERGQGLASFPGRRRNVSPTAWERG